MSKLPLCSSEQIISALIKDGFQFRGKSSGGSHQVFRKYISGERTLVVPVPIGKKYPEARYLQFYDWLRSKDDVSCS